MALQALSYSYKKRTLSVFGVEKESFNANPQNSGGGLYLKKIGSENRDRDGPTVF